MFEGWAYVRGTALQHTAVRAGDFGELGLGTGRCATRDAELEIAVQIFVRIQLRRVRWTIEGTPAARGASSRKAGESAQPCEVGAPTGGLGDHLAPPLGST